MVKLGGKTLQRVALRDLILPVKRSEVLMPGKEYRQIGVKLWGEGTYEREAIDGAQTRYRTLSRVRANDIVVNKIWARHGSVAVVPDRLANYYVSPEFPTFVPIREKLDPRWFHWIAKTRSFWDQCAEKSRGSSGKNRIRPEKFLEIEIPFTELYKQQYIVQWIEKLATKIRTAQELRYQGIMDTEEIIINANERFFGSSVDHKDIRLLDVVEEGGEQVSTIDKPHCDKPYISLDNIEPGTGRLFRVRAAKESGIYGKAVTFNRDNVLYSKLRPYLNKVVLPNFEGTATTEIVVLKPDSEQLEREYLYAFLVNPYFVNEANQKSLGTKMPRTNMNWFREVKIPLPSKPEQLRIVGYLNNLRTKVNMLKSIQHETAATIDSILPSVLNSVFSLHPR